MYSCYCYFCKYSYCTAVTATSASTHTVQLLLLLLHVLILYSCFYYCYFCFGTAVAATSASTHTVQLLLLLLLNIDYNKLNVLRIHIQILQNDKSGKDCMQLPKSSVLIISKMRQGIHLSQFISSNFPHSPMSTVRYMPRSPGSEVFPRNRAERMSPGRRLF